MIATRHPTQEPSDDDLAAAYRAISQPDWPDRHTLAINAARWKVVHGLAMARLRGMPPPESEPARACRPASPPCLQRRANPGRPFDPKRLAAHDLDDDG